MTTQLMKETSKGDVLSIWAEPEEGQVILISPPGFDLFSAVSDADGGIVYTFIRNEEE